MGANAPIRAALRHLKAGGIIGISHVSISQFENQKLSLPEYRIEQMVKAYGFTNDEFHKILGRAPVVSLKDDCHAMIDRMDDEQLVAVRCVMGQILRPAAQASKIQNQGTK